MSVVIVRAEGGVRDHTKCQILLTRVIREPCYMWQATGVGALFKQYKNLYAKCLLMALWQEETWLFWPRALMSHWYKHGKQTDFLLNQMLVNFTI